MRPTAGLEINAGARFDAYRFSGAVTTSFDPKLAARVTVSRDITWVSTFGIAHQQPTYLFPVPGLQIDPSQGLQTTYQMAEGVEAMLPLDMKAKATGFYDVHRKMNDFVSDCGTFAASCSLIDQVDGRTFGVELLLQRALTRKLAGWVAYTLSRAERRIGNVPYLSPFDRTHVASAVLRYDFGRGFDAGARGTYYTGRPDFPNFAFENQQSTFTFGPTEFPQHRLPDFYRIDLRAAKRWSLGGREWIAAVVEFFDVTLSKESVGFRCVVTTGICAAQQIGPIALPSIGVEGGF
jgi:hypothetical protein